MSSKNDDAFAEVDELGIFADCASGVHAECTVANWDESQNVSLQLYIWELLLMFNGWAKSETWRASRVWTDSFCRVKRSDKLWSWELISANLRSQDPLLVSRAEISSWELISAPEIRRRWVLEIKSSSPRRHGKSPEKIMYTFAWARQLDSWVTCYYCTILGTIDVTRKQLFMLEEWQNEIIGKSTQLYICNWVKWSIGCIHIQCSYSVFITWDFRGKGNCVRRTVSKTSKISIIFPIEVGPR